MCGVRAVRRGTPESRNASIIRRCRASLRSSNKPPDTWSSIPSRAGSQRARHRIWKPLLYACAALLVFNGFYALGPDEVGIVERFGRKVMPNGEPGLHYKWPWPVDRLTRMKGASRASGRDRFPYQLRLHRNRTCRL